MSSSGTAASTATFLPGGAPHVASPLDTAKYQADPCRTLTRAQLQSLGLPAATPNPDIAFPAGPKCSWFSTQTNSSIAMSFLTGNKRGLSNLYLKRKEAALFQEIPPINGYPAVIFDEYADQRSRGACSVAVGMSDTLILAVPVQGTPQTKDPCGIAQQAAGLIIENIKGGV
ncbi:DUF3558 domain-containing protein [Gandjariella thermophila]|nr:DUF3558 domain-containing protein [Gandjariella thermophila]